MRTGVTSRPEESRPIASAFIPISHTAIMGIIKARAQVQNVFAAIAQIGGNLLSKIGPSHADQWITVKARRYNDKPLTNLTSRYVPVATPEISSSHSKYKLFLHSSQKPLEKPDRSAIENRP